MEKLIIIKTVFELRRLKEYLRDKQYIAFDTETTGVHRGAEIIGYSVSAELDVGYYVVNSYWDPKVNQLIPEEPAEYAQDFMDCLVGKSLIMQNAPFDCSMVLTNYGIDLMPSVHTDTLILGHLLDENRANGLKERGVELYGEDARQEQIEMKASVHKNGGQLTKACYELYKGDADLIAKYGAKDAILTLKVFYNDVEDLMAQELDGFFYDDESMRLLRGPTYDLNTTGLRVDPEKLALLKSQLEADCLDALGFITKEVTPLVKSKYPGTSKAKTFNVGSSKQLGWLLFVELGNDFISLTEGGKEICRALNIKPPYSMKARREFIREVTDRKGEVWAPECLNCKTGKTTKPKKVSDVQNYLACGKAILQTLAKKYVWVEKYLEYAKNRKLLNTYVSSIEEKMKYNIIRPEFKQFGTTSGRYSSRNPNFQNLPREDKRVKSCIVARPGKVFVGADYSQLEPRVFASQSGDKRLIECFKSGEDFYSVIGAEVFDKLGYSLKKDDDGSFAKEFPELRFISKQVALSATYGTTANKMAPAIGQTVDEAQQVINNYFERFPGVHKFMLKAHDTVKTTGKVTNLFGRPRRMPKALEIIEVYGNQKHGDLPYEARNLLNLAVNHQVQSTGASIMNRAAIACWDKCQELAKNDKQWSEVKIVMQIHDEMILEGPIALANDMVSVLKDAMENTVVLPGVALIAEPKIAYNLADLK